MQVAKVINGPLIYHVKKQPPLAGNARKVKNTKFLKIDNYKKKKNVSFIVILFYMAALIWLLLISLLIILFIFLLIKLKK